MALLFAGCASVTADTAGETAEGTTIDRPERASAGSSSTEATPSRAGAELFDSSAIHEITVSFAQEDYDAMIETYRSSGDKDWIEATVTIDGTTYEHAGMRLKGNSSLRRLRGGARPDDLNAGGSAEQPERLPWLIRLDKNVDGQNHGGIFDLVVRSNNSTTALNEAVSLDLLALAGLPSQKAIAVRFTVNGSDAVLRLVTENPDDVWMAENLSSDGALYKAESTGDYNYRGDDPEAYEEVFDQEAGDGTTDLAPLIDFLDFINNADDATFNAELSKRLDIQSFATYLAMEELLGNFDDMDGPGNNSYLYYDPGTGRFTVVPWDHNLAFGGFGGANPGAPGGVVPSAEAGGAVGGRPPGGAVDGRLPAGAFDRQAGKPGRSNILVERFHANPEFEALYQQQLQELTARLYGSGVAAGVLSQWVSLLESTGSDLVDQSTVEVEAARVSAYFTTTTATSANH